MSNFRKFPTNFTNPFWFILSCEEVETSSAQQKQAIERFEDIFTMHYLFGSWLAWRSIVALFSFSPVSRSAL
jgi:hypothetical protein